MSNSPASKLLSICLATEPFSGTAVPMLPNADVQKLCSLSDNIAHSEPMFLCVALAYGAAGVGVVSWAPAAVRGCEEIPFCLPGFF